MITHKFSIGDIADYPPVIVGGQMVRTHMGLYHYEVLQLLDGGQIKLKQVPFGAPFIEYEDQLVKLNGN